MRFAPVLIKEKGLEQTACPHANNPLYSQSIPLVLAQQNLHQPVELRFEAGDVVHQHSLGLLVGDRHVWANAASSAAANGPDAHRVLVGLETELFEGLD